VESRSATHTLNAELTEGAGELPGLLLSAPTLRTLATGVLDAAMPVVQRAPGGGHALLVISSHAPSC
jgi:hypothetical protein